LRHEGKTGKTKIPIAGYVAVAEYVGAQQVLPLLSLSLARSLLDELSQV
jgi:hypothetical protein